MPKPLYSPSIKKPTFKIRLKKTVAKRLNSSIKPQSSPKKYVQIRNPFAALNLSECVLKDNSNIPATSFDLFNTSINEKIESSDDQLLHNLEEIIESQFFSEESPLSQGIAPEKELESFTEVPKTKSLINRLRIISPHPMDTLNSLTLAEEMKIMSAFCSNNQDCNEFSAVFLRSLYHWIYPCIPGVKLFPRYFSQIQHESLTALHPQILSSMHGAWSCSFQSAYDLLRSDLLDSFFVCGSHLTIIFENDVFNHMSAAVTPTTKGFRDLLIRQNIDFKMPFLDSLSSNENLNVLNSSGNATREVEPNSLLDEDPVEEGDDGLSPDEWLSSIGINKKDFNLSESVVSAGASLEKYDYRKQSLVVITPQSVHAFFNFLLNYKSLVSVSGPLSGVPPTIIASRPFLGASLQKNKFKVSKVSSADKSVSEVCRCLDSQTVSVLDVAGPIMPNSWSLLNEVLTSMDPYSISASSITSTAAFNYNQNIKSMHSDNFSFVYKSQTVTAQSV